ncbi:MAG: hypothetical protein AAFV29_16850, partial [Myxococcota bacterium]
MEVPRLWSAPEGDKIVVAIRRVLAPGVSRGQLWALDGGPGFAGDAFFQPEFLQIAARASLDLIVPAHRGVVGTIVSCPDTDLSQLENWSACAQSLQTQWGVGAAGFDSISAARDVAHFMARVPLSGTRIVFGGSYGSYWGQRLLQVKPSGIDRMWLDSIVDLEGTLERADDHADQAMRQLLANCSDISACRAMFTTAPLERAIEVTERYAGGTGCGQDEGLSQPMFQGLMFAMLSGPPEYWVIAAAGFARADRCTTDDIDALKHAIAQLQERTAPEAQFTYNPVLNRQILYRELYRFDTDAERRS